MRIEAYNQVQQMYRSQRVNKNQKTTKTTLADQVQISSLGRDFQIARTAVKASPDVRTELTAPIKEQIQNGTYSVDTSSFADKLIQKYEEMR
jgi:negative regulator of flagellin synthesis FlgM